MAAGGDLVDGDAPPTHPPSRGTNGRGRGAQAPRQEVGQLKAFVRVDSQQALEAFWH